ncbi:iron complex transport system substrate-binding protein [Brevundimonas vesicularis]|uniref:Iron complex transport system substrate-binding protein n=1 Tax=Brevundimonas vesicularis TaxID=41276 RepID=A0A7W9FS44_BREVE|nr:ABC transporter substrate-binding protein [Brevundimonas vesicularis]MBB5770569.1 iron complex transport system substrate-binding protein [Brevundimonas vesicularis]
MRRVCVALAALAFSSSAAQARPLRIMALDQCADQYVLALSPGADIALSPRADDPDAWLRQQAVGHRRLRPTLEAAVGFQPDVAVRYWGGEPRLLTALAKRGVKVVTIDDAVDLNGVRRNIQTVARDLNQTQRGRALEQQMDAKLAKAAPVRPVTEAPGAVYLTSGGFTAGPGTLMDAMMRAAGFRNLTAAPGFGALSVERIVMNPPVRFVLGFFDQLRADLRGPGRHPVVAQAAESRTAARLPAATLTCPAWFAADAVEMMAKGRP